ncbi:MAG TPA: FKBP-type peptidyl-prolyl cis-trans isomerase [Bdellovibrionales bacterium]|nr:FKBP-type peptidyl-prolyl cis-trans isomerase [Bdellovibrionales bacterium]
MVSAFIRGPLWLGVIFAIAFTGCNPKPKTNKDQVSYTIGAQFGKSLKSQGLDIDPKILARGFAHAYGGGGKDMKLTEEEMQAAMMKLSEEKQKEMKIEAEKNKVKADEFLAENKVKADIKTTSSGLQYKHVTEGSGPSPKPDDVVVVHYKGTLIDGTEFDSSHKRNQPAEFPVKGVIPGWTEGLQLMKKGGKSMFYIAPELAYGDRARQQIPANSVLVFEVELIDVKPPKKK